MNEMNRIAPVFSCQASLPNGDTRYVAIKAAQEAGKDHQKNVPLLFLQGELRADLTAYPGPLPPLQIDVRV